jgi:hypothetical protein
MSFTFTLNGRTYNSDMNGNQVANYLRENLTGNGFVSSLLESRERYGRWTQKQGEWAHKLALDHMGMTQHVAPAAVAPAPETPTYKAEEVKIFLPVVLEFLSRPTKLKRIKLTFKHNDGEVTIKRSQNKPLFWVAKNGVLKGSINTETGEYKERERDASISATLDGLEENPMSFAAEHGKTSGQCCFCSLPLTDERSLNAGWGPICASHYGLLWGK